MAEEKKRRGRVKTLLGHSGPKSSPNLPSVQTHEADAAATIEDPRDATLPEPERLAPQPILGPAPAPGDPPDRSRSVSRFQAPDSKDVPLVEIEVVHEFGPAPASDTKFRTVEVWTRNRVYSLGSMMECTEVRDQETRKAVLDHPFLGARLLGGQHRAGDTMEMSHPFPRPGTEAVFEKRDQATVRFFRTSTVTRVVLRLHILTVTATSVVPTWAEITASRRGR
jgi:hypothetical protein